MSTSQELIERIDTLESRFAFQEDTIQKLNDVIVDLQSRLAGERVPHEILQYGDKSVGLAMDQDLSITTGQHLGFRSRGYEGVYLSGQEARVRRYHEVIDEYLQGVRPHGRLNTRPATVKSIQDPS